MWFGGSRDPGALAERLGRMKSRMVAVQAVLFTVWQAAYFSPGSTESGRWVDHVRIASWVVWVVALLAFLAWGGGWLWRREVRRLLNDELAVHHRREAQRTGFWAAMAACLLAYGLSYYETLEPREVVHLILSLGVGAALFRLAWLDLRAERAG